MASKGKQLLSLYSGGSGPQKASRLPCQTLCLRTPAAKLLLPTCTRHMAALTQPGKSLGILTPWNAVEGPSLCFSHIDFLLLTQPFCSPNLDQGLRRVTCHWIQEERRTDPPLGPHLLECRVGEQMANARGEAKRQEGRELPALLTAISPGPSRAFGP